MTGQSDCPVITHGRVAQSGECQVVNLKVAGSKPVTTAVGPLELTGWRPCHAPSSTWSISLAAKAPLRRRGDHRFKSGMDRRHCPSTTLPHSDSGHAPVAQRKEHLTTNQGVGGSNPSGRTQLLNKAMPDSKVIAQLHPTATIAKHHITRLERCQSPV